MKTWSERLAEADARIALPWWRRVLHKRQPQLYHWPFTRDDMDSATRVARDLHPDGSDLCMAGEVTERYGFTDYDCVLWNLGHEFFKAILYRDINAAWRLHDAIEERALQLKREATS